MAETRTSLPSYTERIEELCNMRTESEVGNDIIRPDVRLAIEETAGDYGKSITAVLQDVAEESTEVIRRNRQDIEDQYGG